MQATYERHCPHSPLPYAGITMLVRSDGITDDRARIPSIAYMNSDMARRKLPIH